MEKWRDTFLDLFMKSREDANERLILKEALDRLKLATRVPCSTPDERFSSRLNIFHNGLSVDASNVIDDDHTLFRVVSKSIVYTEDEYDMIRMCLTSKLGIDIDTLKNAGEDVTFVSEYKNAIQYNQSCLNIWPFIIQECANLFRVTFYLIRVDVDEVNVFSPTGLNAQSFTNIWLIASSETLNIWNTALTTAPPPKDISHIMLQVGLDDATKVVELCRDMVGGEGTPVQLGCPR
uniref:uncharacterized protein LOC122582839 isoform X2 n=1 Tax=Erigeron canadensis TaxID=72917 RepID=UPI001CB8D4BA|nr:uncharacterized protein LOC122582839 isoform X2 [Erigeron canadensis]